VCNYEVHQNGDSTEFMVDFLLSQSDGDKLSIVEFNMYRYKKVYLGNGKMGILVYAYTKRSYGDAITEFMQQLGDEREKMMNSIIYAPLPPIAISK